jgi:hypothetical protein
MPASPPPLVAHGPGPSWFRYVLLGIALCYFAVLVKRLPDHRLLRPVAFFTQATGLFTGAATYNIDYRLEAWSCDAKRWQPIDVRPYFPIRAEDKESRFHRLAHFYKRNRTVLQALDRFVSERHPHVDDGVAGPIGGIRLYQLLEPMPPVGSPVARWRFEPLAPRPDEHVRDLFYTRASERKQRCEAAR